MSVHEAQAVTFALGEKLDRIHPVLAARVRRCLQ